MPSVAASRRDLAIGYGQLGVIKFSFTVRFRPNTDELHSQFSLRLTRGNITANKVTFDLYYSTVAYFKLTVGLFLFFVTSPPHLTADWWWSHFRLQPSCAS